MVKVQMCCGTFPLDVSAAAAAPLQHPGKAVGSSTGREPGAVLHPYSQSSPSALYLLPEERFFSPFDASSILDSTAGEGRVCCGVLVQGSNLNLKKREIPAQRFLQL